MKQLLRVCLTIPVTFLLIALVRFYQWGINPFVRMVAGDCCRFEPSCSHYFIGAVKKYGPIRGTIKGIWRVIRCNPWCDGGDDPP
ncbi:MAG: membrane protein insertion efficiency factor YidD [Planctomycetaceae bacterium]|nr:membrane protein insertion efficiency factor YidD [Planctomycetaceae bacterium]